MALAGTAFLALFNDFEPRRDEEYNEWHSREHVPERLAVPGMLRARRYVNREEAQFPYFTLYEMESAAVLQSPPYLHLLDHPTPWSARMRPSFRQFLRIPCELLASAGEAGVAGSIAASVLQAQADWQPLCDALARQPGVLAAHVGQQDASLRGPAVAAAQTLPAGPTFVLLVEAQERRWLARHQPPLDVLASRAYDLMHVLRPAP